LKIALHNSGTLWEYFQERDPQYIEDVKDLVGKGQIELIGGTFFEAILPSIPDADKVNQLKLLKDYVEKEFQTPVNGAWVTERVWEPNLPKFYSETGYQYVFLDDYHFAQAGEKGPFYGYYLTEDQGYQVFVFPIDKKLRYLIPWRGPEEIVEYLKSFSQRDKDVYILYADDGEKFGLWQGTYELCYTNRYMDRLLEALNQAGIDVILPSEVIENSSQTGIVYLPTSTYPEMSEWSLDKDVYRDYAAVRDKLTDTEGVWVHAGFWRRFLKSHPHNRWMYGRVVSLSRYLNDLTPRHPRKNKALMELYRAEANDVFWHGVFGGLYLTHLRRNLFHRLIKAKVTADGSKKSYMDVQDFDIDGEDEILIATESYHAYVKPKRGSIVEFDLLNAEENMCDLLDAEPKQHCLFDDLWQGDPVMYELNKKNAGRSMDLVFSGSKGDVDKTITFSGDSVDVAYKVHELGCLNVQLPISLWNPNNALLEDGDVTPLNVGSAREGVTHLQWKVEGEKVNLTFSKPARVEIEPILITHKSELFEEVTYQGTIINVSFNLAEEEQISLRLSLPKEG
jgi:alpha-amylase